jgi:NitT/TauT family transport system substrate-binding protein
MAVVERSEVLRVSRSPAGSTADTSLRSRPSVKPRARAVLLALSVILLVSACADDGAQTGDARKVTLGIAVQKDLANSPLVLADKEGLYRRYGLEVELVYFNGGGALVQAMSGGRADYGWVSHAPVVKAIEQGAPMAVVAETNRSAIGWGLVVAPDSPIKQVSDLRAGMTISYTSEGALTNWYALYVAKQAGLAPTDIRGVPIGTSLPAISNALSKGQVDAATVLLPWGNILEGSGQGRWVTHMEEELPNFSFSGIAATTKAAEDTTATSCLVGAYVAAVKWMADHPAETQRWFEEFYGVDAALAKSAYAKLMPDFSPDGAMDPKRLQFTLDALSSVPGFLKGSVSAEQVLRQARPADASACATD